MKKLALISSFCDTQKKIDILKNNIKTLKSLEIDVLLSSPINLPSDIVSECDFYFQNKINPIVKWPIKANMSWTVVKSVDRYIKLTRTLADYGWANIYQVKNLSDIALMLDYERFYHIIYDLELDDFTINELLSNEKTCNFYPFNEWECSLHLMIFDRDNLSKFSKSISYENYISSGLVTENWLKNYIDNCGLDYTIDKRKIRDLIHYYDGKNIHNYSVIPGISFFITNQNSVYRVYFYNISNTIQINMCIDGEIKSSCIGNLEYIEFPIDTNSVTLSYEEFTQDISNDLKEMSLNYLDIL